MARGLGDRSGSPTGAGWPAGAQTVAVLAVRDTQSSPIYTSWAQTWAANKAYWWWNWAYPNAAPNPLPPDPTCIEYDKGSNNTAYPSYDFSAMSLVVQAGLTQYRPNRDQMGNCWRPLGVVEFSEAWAQV